MSAEQQKQDDALIEQALKLLSEHFDAVLIFVSRHEPGELDGTLKMSRGAGNFYARYGQAKEWVIMEEEGMREHLRNQEP